MDDWSKNWIWRVKTGEREGEYAKEAFTFDGEQLQTATKGCSSVNEVPSRDDVGFK